MDIHSDRTARLRAAGATHPGLKRSGNQDTFLCESVGESGLYAAIDGVGGYAGGDVAAALARERVRARVATRAAAPLELLREAVADANAAILEQRAVDARLEEMSCVLTVAVADPRRERVYAAHVGDTRLYRFSDGRLQKLTRDHSFVGLREEAGQLSEAEAMAHPRRNEILRDVGSAPHHADDAEFIDAVEAPFGEGDALLLCSDGLTDLVPLATLTEILRLRRGNPEAAVQTLIEAALDAGGSDNVTVVVVEYPPTAAPPAAGPLAATIPAAPQSDPTPAPEAAAQGGLSSGPAPPTATNGAASGAEGLRVHQTLGEQARTQPTPSPPVAPRGVPAWVKGAAAALALAALAGAALVLGPRLFGEDPTPEASGTVEASGGGEAVERVPLGPGEPLGAGDPFVPEARDLGAALLERAGETVRLGGGAWSLDSTRVLARSLVIDGGGATLTLGAGEVAFHVSGDVPRVVLRDLRVEVPVGARGLVRLGSPGTRVTMEGVEITRGGEPLLAGEVPAVVLAPAGSLSFTIGPQPASGAAVSPEAPAPGPRPGP